MARDAGLPHVEYELETCDKIFTIKIDSSVPSQQGLGKQGATLKRRKVIPIVRAQLRCVDNDSYSPHDVPIGPYHQHRSAPWIEKEKTHCAGFLQSLLCDESTKEDLTGLMEELEAPARECYAADGVVGDMTPEQLSTMLLNDGCYLLLFFVDYESAGNGGGAPRQERPAAASRNTLVRDVVFLLENQIPLFVLQRLHERVTGGTSGPVIVDCIADAVQQLLQKMHFISRKRRPAPPPACCHHLLHVVHAYFKPAAATAAAANNNQPTTWAPRRQRRRHTTGRWRRATEYRRYANVRFKPRELEDDVESCVLDVHLVRGTLWLPRLRVDSNTWTILRNLMALEEHDQHHRRPVTAYCLFISQLACSSEDVGLLRRGGILDHFLGNDEEVAQGFADLCRGVLLEVDDSDRNYLKPLWHELEDRSLWFTARWFLHGQNVWIAAGFLVALILVICQVMQIMFYYIHFKI